MYIACIPYNKARIMMAPVEVATIQSNNSVISWRVLNTSCSNTSTSMRPNHTGTADHDCRFFVRSRLPFMPPPSRERTLAPVAL